MKCIKYVHSSGNGYLDEDRKDESLNDEIIKTSEKHKRGEETIYTKQIFVATGEEYTIEARVFRFKETIETDSNFEPLKPTE
jgi:hypothetical protein